jgi:hypothetical protein
MALIIINLQPSPTKPVELKQIFSGPFLTREHNMRFRAVGIRSPYRDNHSSLTDKRQVDQVLIWRYVE